MYVRIKICIPQTTVPNPPKQPFRQLHHDIAALDD